MILESDSFLEGHPIPPEFAFARPDPETRVRLSENQNPHLRWSQVPAGTRSFAVLCVDPDVPSVGDDVNQPGRTVPAELPRTDFVHWLMVDIPSDLRELLAGSCSSAVSPGGKRKPAGPPGARQGANDYGVSFEGDAAMEGVYLGYDGPGPPWNDALVHRYRFELLALDVASLGLGEAFKIEELRSAAEGHVLERAVLIGTYTLNPDLG